MPGRRSQPVLSLLRHLWIDGSDTRRAIPSDVARRLHQRVIASEQRHRGQVRICVEGSLPLASLWRHVRQRIPMSELLRARAVAVFAELHVWDTEQNNGVLIYLLLAERSIELVADRGLDRRVDAAIWNGVVERLADALAASRFEQGLNDALEAVTALLVQHFPATGMGADAPLNELPDEPVLR